MSTSGALRSNTPTPSWAGTNKNPWIPSASAYNDTAAVKLRSRAAIGRVAAGLGQFHVAVIGASLECGYNGVGLTQDSTKSWPRQFVQELAVLLGGVSVFDGIVPGTGISERWTLGGGANQSTVPAYLWLNGASTASITLTAGQDVWVFVPSSNAAGIAWTLDGVAQANTPTGGVNVTNSQHIAGAANVAHTLAFTGPATSNFITGVASIPTGPGIVLHNLALGGASAAFPTSGGNQQYLNWTDATNALSLNPSRTGMLTTLGITPDLVIVDLGGNDALHAVPVATFKAALASIVAQFPNSDIMLVNTWNVTPIGAAAYVPYQQAVYAQADASNARLFDICDVIGGLLNGIARGVIGPDNIHPIYSLQSVFGRQNALAFAA